MLLGFGFGFGQRRGWLGHGKRGSVDLLTCEGTYPTLRVVTSLTRVSSVFYHLYSVLGRARP